MADKKQLQIVLKMKDLASKELKRVQGVARKFGTSLSGMFKGIAKTVLSLKGVIVGLLAVMALRKVATGFVEVASTTEQLGIRLRVLLGDVKEAGLLFDELTEFAGRVPFEYREIMESATMLAGIMKGGREEIMSWMPLIGDLAAATGLSIQVTSEQVMRMLSAGASAADRFRERGVLAMLGFTAGVAYTVEETSAKLKSAWKATDSKFAGSMKLLAKSWGGLMSMMSDAWFQFRDEVMRAGLFDFMKKGIQTILDEINRLKKEGVLKDWAVETSESVIDIIATLMRAWVWVKRIIEGAKTVFAAIKIETQLLSIVIATAIRDAMKGLELLSLGVDKTIGLAKKSLLFLIEMLEKNSLAFKALGIAFKGTFSDLKGFLKSETSSMNDVTKWFAEQQENFAANVVFAWVELEKDIKTLTDSIKKQQENTGENTERLIENMRAGIEELKKSLEEARALTDIDPGGNTETFFAGIKTGFTNYINDAKAAFKTGELFAKASAKAMGNAMSSMFFDVITTKVGNAREHFRKFLLSILRMVTDLMAQKVMISFLSTFMKGAVVVPAGGVVGPVTPEYGLPGRKMAKGGIIPGFQDGGIVDRPTLIGEGRQSEAIVPLPDNKSIPVKLMGDGERAVTVNFNIVTNDASSFSASLVRDKETIQGIIAEAMRSNRDFRKVMA